MSKHVNAEATFSLPLRPEIVPESDGELCRIVGADGYEVADNMFKSEAMAICGVINSYARMQKVVEAVVLWDKDNRLRSRPDQDAWSSIADLARSALTTSLPASYFSSEPTEADKFIRRVADRVAKSGRVDLP